MLSDVEQGLQPEAPATHCMVNQGKNYDKVAGAQQNVALALESLGRHEEVRR